MSNDQLIKANYMSRSWDVPHELEK